MKKIVFITNSIGFGGAEKMIFFLANQLYLRNYKCLVLNLNNVPNYINSFKQKVVPGIEIITFNKKECKNKNLDSIKFIKKECKKFNADLIIGFTEYPNLYGCIVGKILHIPFIMSERGNPYVTSGTGINSKISKYIINHSSGGVFQTEGAKSFYGERLKEKGVIIPNPIFAVDKINYIPYEKKDKTIVSFGRLDNNQKRYDIMLKAFKLFSEKHPDYILKIYGKGLQEEEIKQWTIDLGINDKVKFMGLTTNSMKSIESDRIFLITSDFEGISNSLLEAMAVGLACVSTDHTPGGARFLIKDHESGILTPVGDVDKIADALKEFADNTELAMKCGENARYVLDSFSPKKIIDMWEKYICCFINK